jgi:hypothetical protein
MRTTGRSSSLFIVCTVLTACFSSPEVGVAIDTDAFETTGDIDPASSTATDGRVDDETTVGLDETTVGLDETTSAEDDTGACMPGVFGQSHLGQACFQ